MNNNMSDKALLEYYRVEFFKEWYTAWKNGTNLSAADIRFRLGLS